MAHAPRGVVLAAVAGAEPAAPVAARIGRLVAQRHAAQMGADADQHDPLVVARLHPRLIRLRLDKLGQLHVLGFLDLLVRAVADEDRLALPEHGDPLADHDRRQVDLDGGQRQHVLRRVHVVDEGPSDGGRADAGGGAGDQLQEIAFGDVGMAMVSNGGGRISHLPLDTIALPAWRRTRQTAGGPTACPEFIASRPNVTADGRILGSLPHPCNTPPRGANLPMSQGQAPMSQSDAPPPPRSAETARAGVVREPARPAMRRVRGDRGRAAVGEARPAGSSAPRGRGRAAAAA